MSRLPVLLRLFAALLIGWLCACMNIVDFCISLVHNLIPSLTIDENWLPFLFPVGLGIIASLASKDRRNQEFFRLALFSGPLCLTGGVLYWLPQALRADAACPTFDAPFL